MTFSVETLRLLCLVFVRNLIVNTGKDSDVSIPPRFVVNSLDGAIIIILCVFVDYNLKSVSN